MRAGIKNKIVTIGLTGFPYSLAPSQKLLLMGKALLDNDTGFLVICNTFIKKTGLNQNLKKIGRKEGIIYLTTSPEIFTPASLSRKVVSKIRGFINEFIVIDKLRKQKSLKSVFVYSKSSAYCFFWSCYFRIFNIPSGLIYFELISSFPDRKGVVNKLNDWYYDKLNLRRFNGIITISEKLIRHINRVSPAQKIIKIPPLVDLELFDNCRSGGLTNNYFLYCGTLAYFDVIEFIIDSYFEAKNVPNFPLYLVLNGDKRLLDKIKDKVKSKGLTGRVKIFSNLTYEELIQFYLNSFALLIPLRDVSQDTARFPQKVAEYCAAKRPVISTRLGELPCYFDDSSMIFANHYDVHEYAAKMDYVLENSLKAEEIALNGFKVAEKNFNYRSFSRALNSFISNL